MTLPKKASRNIEIGGKVFRWMVKRVGPVDDGTIRLTVENPESGEIRQRVFCGWGIPGEERHESPVIKPKDVRQFIESFDG